MSRQAEHATTFHRLHTGAGPLILFNAWDAGSARAIASAGALAIATGSWSVAAAHGCDDGERLALADVLANARRIVQAVDLPVSIDLEAGYGIDADGVGASISALIETGAIGCNLEDGIAGAGAMRTLEEQAARLRAARAAADRAGLALFVNARTDAFLLAAPARHGEFVDDVLARARAYAEAGGNGLFVPGLVDETLIRTVVEASPLPVNVMIGPGSPSIGHLAALGVARISHGPGPYIAAMDFVRQSAEAAHTAASA